MRTCERCNGKGKVAGFEHVYGGLCYACRGTGTIAPRKRTTDKAEGSNAKGSTVRLTEIGKARLASTFWRGTPASGRVVGSVEGSLRVSFPNYGTITVQASDIEIA